MKPYPLVFKPILKQKVWGGRRLGQLGKPLPAGAAIGESWELADLPQTIPDGRSVITNGPLAGRTLHEVIGDHKQPVMPKPRWPSTSSLPHFGHAPIESWSMRPASLPVITLRVNSSICVMKAVASS